MRNVYLDHNATTPVHPEVIDAMLPFMNLRFGNPSSVHSYGQDTRDAMEKAREVVAGAFRAKKDEIVFTSGGTESDNLAITGTARAVCKKGKHIITSTIEHHAVLATCEYLSGVDYEITTVPCDEYGVVDPEQVRRAIRGDTILVTIMHANNEVGTIERIEEIAEIAREKGVLFHSDAVQSFGKIDLDTSRLKADLLSVSSHKIYGPKGVGALYVRRGTPLSPIMFGGHHEKKRRAGTENVPGVVGFAKAVELVTKDVEARQRDTLSLRNKLEKGIMSTIPHVKLNGHPTKRLPNTLNVSFEYIEGESLVLSLDMEGIAVSSGSACTSGSLEPSHVLLAMGVAPDVAQGSVRFSLGRDNTAADIDYVLEVLPRIVERLRSISPLFKKSATGIGKG